MQDSQVIGKSRLQFNQPSFTVSDCIEGLRQLTNLFSEQRRTFERRLKLFPALFLSGFDERDQLLELFFSSCFVSFLPLLQCIECCLTPNRLLLLSFLKMPEQDIKTLCPRSDLLVQRLGDLV